MTEWLFWLLSFWPYAVVAVIFFIFCFVTDFVWTAIEQANDEVNYD